MEEKLVHVYGTSHVSEESLRLVEEKIEEHQPGIVALELDGMRLKSLVQDQRRSSGPLFIRAIQKFQESIGKKTGVMPGEEMLYAYRKAVKDGRDIALIDRDVRETIKNLKKVKTREKIKAIAQVVLSLPMKNRFNLTEIPDQETIEELLIEMEFKFPELYQVLVEDRNQYMVKALKQLQEEHPETTIVAFVGAAHQKEIQKHF